MTFKFNDIVEYKDSKCHGVGKVIHDYGDGLYIVEVEEEHKKWCIFKGGTARIFEREHLKPWFAPFEYTPDQQGEKDDDI